MDKTLAEIHDRLAGACSDASVDDHEFFTQTTRTLTAGARDGVIETFEAATTLGTAVRVIVDGRPGFSYFFGNETEAGARAVEAAVNSARELVADEHVGFEAAADLPRVVGLFDENLTAVPIEAKKQRAVDLEAAALGYDTRVKKARQAEYRESIGSVRLTNSSGLVYEDEQSVVSVSVLVMAVDGDEQEMAWDFDISRDYDGLDEAEVAARAARMAVDQLGAGSVGSGRYPVILTNQVAADFLGMLSPSFLLDNVLKGKSQLAGKEGVPLLSKALTIIDDGLYPGGLGSGPADDEGSPRGRRVMVDSGVVGGFLCDWYWGRRGGRSSTGNATRGGLTSGPVVGVSNFYVEPGQDDFDELVSGVERGLVVTEVMGLHTADPISGRFSVGACGHWIEGGRRVRPVKGIAVAGDLLELFGSVESVGSDLRFIGRHGSPSLLIGSLAVSGR